MTREEILKTAKPILFNTDMTVAILENRKGVTRRIMKPQPLFKTHRKFIFDDATCPRKWEDCDDITKTYRYQPGDYLYVRETWSEWTDGYLYKAWTGPFAQPGKPSVLKWHPSIHMPKEAARIFLKVTDVRLERLQDIDGTGILAEGVSNGKSNPAMGKRWDNMQRIAFSELWDSTISKKDLSKYGWEANPWVWVIEFERVEV